MAPDWASRTLFWQEAKVPVPGDSAWLWMWRETDTLRICLLGTHPPLSSRGRASGELGRCCPRALTQNKKPQAISTRNMVRR